MPSSVTNLPLYARLSFIIVGLIGFFYILVVGEAIIVPFVFAGIIAILLNPIVNFLHGKGVHRVISIIISLAVAVLVLGAIGWFLISQIASLGDSLPQFKPKFEQTGQEFVGWVSHTFNISTAKIDQFVANSKKGIDGMQVMGQALGALSGIIVIFVMPVFIFIVLFYKPLFLEFISMLFKSSDHAVVKEVLAESKTLIQSYLVGLSVEAAVVAALNSVGLIILGVPYAILLGAIGALLNIIPYVGIWIAGAITMLVAVGASSGSAALGVIILYVVVQFIDNQIIVPRIVAGKVKINAFISIIVVLIGSAVWGVAGMFLAIPLTAIMKVIFDRVEDLQPFGYLLGDKQPADDKINSRRKRPSK